MRTGALAYGALAHGRDRHAGRSGAEAPQDFKLIGRSQPRRDTAAKVNGSAVFGIDVRPEGMVYAAARMAPVIGASVARSRTGRRAENARRAAGGGLSAALPARTGAGAGVAVLARSYWQARQAALALPLEWQEGPGARLNSAAIYADMAARLDSEAGHTYYAQGDAEGAMQQASSAAGVQRITAEYRAPYLAHAAMEPINCTAQVKDGKVRLWVPTQSPGFAVQAAAKAAGVAEDQVELVVTMLGGGFGRRLDVDMVSQVVAVAKQAGGVPVQMIWSREDDTGHDVYRPAALSRFQAALDGQGRVLGLVCKSASGSVSHQFFARNLGLPGGPDKTTAEGEFDMQYEFPHQRISHVIVDSAVPLGYWRSVGHSHNAFFKESFIDELAHAAGRIV
jgi:isoquinoline 1-oxidoreductase beta subunit